MGCRKTIFLNNNSRIFHQKEQINKKQQQLINYISQEKSKLKPNIEKVNKYQQDLNDIENYKTEGTIINSTKS